MIDVYDYYIYYILFINVVIGKLYILLEITNVIKKKITQMLDSNLSIIILLTK